MGKILAEETVFHVCNSKGTQHLVPDALRSALSY